jgi:hypothetical protein
MGLLYNVQYSSEAFPVSNPIDTREVIHITKTVEGKKCTVNSFQFPTAGISVRSVMFKMPNNG